MSDRIVCLLDCETTGLDDDSRVVELAWMTGTFLSPTPKVLQEFQSLVNPMVPIPATASATHHITDAMVKNAPTFDHVEAGLPFADLYVAHNAKFDQRFLPALKGRKWACTMKCAYEQWHDAPSYGLQALRYWLKTVGPNADAGHSAHRAAYDVETLAGVFDELRRAGWTYERMIDVSARPRFLRTISFGKHEGARFDELPRSYVQWMRTQNDWDEDVIYTLSKMPR